MRWRRRLTTLGKSSAPLTQTYCGRRFPPRWWKVPRSATSSLGRTRKNRWCWPTRLSQKHCVWTGASPWGGTVRGAVLTPKISTSRAIIWTRSSCSRRPIWARSRWSTSTRRTTRGLTSSMRTIFPRGPGNIFRTAGSLMKKETA